MQSLSISYSLKWVVKDNDNYCMTPCRKLVNIKRGRIVKCVLNGGSIGWWVGGNFVAKSKMNSKLELIKENKTPF